MHESPCALHVSSLSSFASPRAHDPTQPEFAQACPESLREQGAKTVQGLRDWGGQIPHPSKVRRS